MAFLQSSFLDSAMHVTQVFTVISSLMKKKQHVKSWLLHD